MSDHVEQGQVKQIITQLKDGTTWSAEVDLDGKLRLLELLKDPDNKYGDEEEEEPTPTSPEPAEAEPQPAPPEEWEQGEELDDYTDTELEDLIESMSHRELEPVKNRNRVSGGHTKPPEDFMKKTVDPAFKARLSSVMLDNKYDRRVKGRTRGKLDMNRLFKVPTGSKSVFTQKESRKGKQYNVVLLIDESGSMAGRKSELAAESAVFITRQLTNIGVNVGVIGFEDSVQVHKDILEKPDYEHIYDRVASARGGNCDYDAMRRAYKMFDKAPKGKNILIMLSDGNPTGYYPADTYDSRGNKENLLKPMPGWKYFDDYGWEDDDAEEYETLEHFHHLVRSNKHVSSIGIGIQEGGWQIPDHEVIHNVEDLKSTIIKQLRKHIKRG